MYVGWARLIIFSTLEFFNRFILPEKIIENPISYIFDTGTTFKMCVLKKNINIFFWILCDDFVFLRRLLCSWAIIFRRLFSKRCTFGSKSGTKFLVRQYQANFSKTVPEHLKVCHIWLTKF